MFGSQAQVAGVECSGCATRRRGDSLRISAKADYAVRAAAELAAAGAVSGAGAGGRVKAEALARSQGIPLSFLENILRELRRAGIVRAQRGAEGGYLLARPAGEVTVADVLRAVDGPLAAVQGTSPDALEHTGAAERLPDVWVAVRAAVRGVLEGVTLADLAAGVLPAAVTAGLADPEAWRPH